MLISPIGLFTFICITMFSAFSSFWLVTWMAFCSEILTFLSFQISHKIARKELLHISLPLGDLIGTFLCSKNAWIEFGKHQLQPSHPIIEFYMTWAKSQFRRRWLTFSSAKRRGQALTIIFPFPRRLSRVRILLQRANHPKAGALEGALIFQTAAEFLGLSLPRSTKQKEATEKELSWEAIHVLESSLSSGIKTLLCICRSNTNWLFSCSDKFHLKIGPQITLSPVFSI